ncbi:MBL fold metallo-hydrolase, partial [Halapricum sp. CBA1109]|nr:MBL fold metallo-hydrolase [Halapricum sp. CBA1109]
MSPSIRRRRITVPVATRAPDGQVAAYLLGEDLLVDPGGHSDALDRAVA